MPPNRMLTTAEAAEQLNVTPGRVRQFIVDKRLKAEKVGRDRLIRQTELDRFIREHNRQPGRPWPSRNAPPATPTDVAGPRSRTMAAAAAVA